MTSEVAELIGALRAGTMSLGEVAERFRSRSWPRRGKPQPTTYLEMAAQAQEDPEPYLEDSFDDVSAAFHRGDLSGAEYEVLAQAMAASKRAEDERRDGGRPGRNEDWGT